LKRDDDTALRYSSGIESVPDFLRRVAVTHELPNLHHPTVRVGHVRVGANP
jgi:hypothetical protein